MARRPSSTLRLAALCGCLLSVSQLMASPSLTIYNGDFAVVRDNIELNLKKGNNQVRYQDITYQMEADSVVLRPSVSNWKIKIDEQNYLSRPINEALLLQHFEGKTIDFEIQRNKETQIVSGKIIRSGHGGNYNNTPIIEMEGKTRFGLPGRPLFPALKSDALLKPTLDWQLSSNKAGKLDLELAYLTAGLSWKADYNVIAKEGSNLVDLNGWVTFQNQSGKDFNNAKVKLMAGDIQKLQPAPRAERRLMKAAMADEMGQSVSEKSFDEYHLYSIAKQVDLRNGESKQIGFIDAHGVKAKTLFIYDGAQVNQYYRGNMEHIRTDPNYGTQSNKDVWIMREFENSEKNQLGMPLPKGRIRFYQQDEDGQLEFLGENNIDHTPKNSLVSLYTGNAFDIKGDRKRSDFKVNNRENWVKESFEITVKNEKKTNATVRVVEHLYRWANWTVESKSHNFTKKDSQTIEFNIDLKSEQEKTIKYTVHYSW